MQNRNMFLYRRQGPKKRAKPGPSRKNRGPQKGLPNSARELLPLIQPATKALAQMLAGRSGASGQLGHARAVLAQTERLVSERAHNRLNPAEREEFFEQIARLKLTLADAESEAEVQAMEDESPPPPPTTVDRERLKEMALALTISRAVPADDSRHRADPAQSSDQIDEADGPETVTPAGPTADDAQETASITKPIVDDSNQLRLPRAGAERVTIQPDATRPRTNGKRRLVRPEESPPPRATTRQASPKAAPKPQVIAGEPQQSVEVTASQPGPTSQQKLPKGWIIDDEGFVVPGPAA